MSLVLASSGLFGALATGQLRLPISRRSARAVRIAFAVLLALNIRNLPLVWQCVAPPRRRLTRPASAASTISWLCASELACCASASSARYSRGAVCSSLASSRAGNGTPQSASRPSTCVSCATTWSIWPRQTITATFQILATRCRCVDLVNVETSLTPAARLFAIGLLDYPPGRGRRRAPALPTPGGPADDLPSRDQALRPLLYRDNRDVRAAPAVSS